MVRPSRHGSLLANAVVPGRRWRESDLGVDLDDVVFWVGEEQRAVPERLVRRRLKRDNATLSELSGGGLDIAGRYAERELNRRGGDHRV